MTRDDIIRMAREKWCDWFHAGGDIKRDPTGCINWQCRTCGRWGEPVSLDREKSQIDSDIAAAIRARGDKT